MAENDKLVAKEEANYKVDSQGDSPCGSCANFISPSSCKLVSGTISENGTCDMYQPVEADAAGADAPDLMSQLFGGMSNG